MDISLIQDWKLEYPRDFPFHPSESYPEYPFSDIGNKNCVYDAIRTLFIRLDLDKKNYTSSSWNPLGEYIKRGDSVLIKPNMVFHRNPSGDINAVITHGSLIRALLDYVYIALKGTGCITIGDAPIQSCFFNDIIRQSGIHEIIQYYSLNSNIKIKLVDFRKYSGYPIKLGGLKRNELSGDPEGYSLINLRSFSELIDLDTEIDKFRVTNYDKTAMKSYHNNQNHKYLISNTALQADVIINLPKLKTHCKAGITGSLKNMIGVIGTKDCLPHHRIGSKSEGGDEYINANIRKKGITKINEQIDVTNNRFLNTILKSYSIALQSTKYILPFEDDSFYGSWYGNDTIPRSIIDVNKIIHYADKNGKLQDSFQRKIFTVIDGITAGQGEGPLTPTPLQCGTLIAGDNSVAVDLVASQIMGFDYNRIPTLSRAINLQNYPLFDKKIDELNIHADNVIKFDKICPQYCKNFTPPHGWFHHIELCSNE